VEDRRLFFWKNKEKDRRTKRRTGNFFFFFLRKGAATTTVVELPCLRKRWDFFFERENGNGERTEMALAILENKIKTEKTGEDLEAKVFDRMPQREVGLFGKKRRRSCERLRGSEVALALKPIF